jgi:hypothetical protein
LSTAGVGDESDNNVEDDAEEEGLVMILRQLT